MIYGSKAIREEYIFIWTTDIANILIMAPKNMGDFDWPSILDWKAVSGPRHIVAKVSGPIQIASDRIQSRIPSKNL